MTTTVLGIYNAAISAVHGKGRLASLTDNTRERTECDIWYDQVVEQVQEAAYWPSSRALMSLTRIATRDFSETWSDIMPEPEFMYGFELPDDYLRAWHLSQYEPFTISWNARAGTEVVQLSCNTNPALLVYARKDTDPARWTPGQRSATIFALAASIVGGLKGDASLVSQNYELANRHILQARMSIGNNLNNHADTLAPALQARGHAYGAEETRYYYPNGSLFPSAVN